MRQFKTCVLSSVCLVSAMGGLTGQALAQTAEPAAQERPVGDAASLLEDVVVTARKRGAENVQDVPLAVTAYGAEQLEALNFRDLASLSNTMPNVQMDGVGTIKGVANFSIRGLGLGSSIPSIDPTVGVFVDGVYMGTTAGVILDNFDIEGLEVLRGPQGVLFGRNVTGGAVLVRTTDPTAQFSASGRVAVESGPNWIVDGTVSGPIVGDTLLGKLAVYRSDDDGYFTNRLNGQSQGASTTSIVRVGLRWLPTEALDVNLRLEHGEAEGEGPAGQNHGFYSRDSFDSILNIPGYYKSDWDSATLEANYHVPFGDGTITGIAGYRQLVADSLTDIDATPSQPGVFDGVNFGNGAIFNLYTLTDQNQVSAELRYAGTFGKVDITTGVFYFQQDLLYVEKRIIDTNVAVAGEALTAGGGLGDFSTSAVFAAADWHLNDQFTLNAGLRYTSENKRISLSRLRGVGNVVDGMLGADYDTRTLRFTDTGFDLSYENLSPKLGFQWTPNDDTQVYGSWSIGYRAGGMNFRYTALAIPPKPFDDEKQTSYEIGLKHDFLEGRGRANISVFKNQIEGMQRDQIIPDPISGVQQIISNAGDADIWGAEFEGRFRVTDNLTLIGQAGYIEAEYTKILVDLSGDGVINGTDLALQPPRLAPWTYGATAIYDTYLGDLGVLSSRVSYYHRDAVFFTDNNLGYLNELDTIDLSFNFKPSTGVWQVTAFAKNLTDESSFSGDSLLPDIQGFGGDGAAGPRPLPTFSPLNKGRVIGAELRVAF